MDIEKFVKILLLTTPNDQFIVRLSGEHSIAVRRFREDRGESHGPKKAFGANGESVSAGGRLKSEKFLAGVAMERHVEGARRETAGVGAARAYELVRKELFGEFGADFFRSYIDPLRLVAEMDGVLLFRAGSQVAKERLTQQVQHRLEARLRAYEPRVSATQILLEHEIPDDVRALADARIEEARPQAPAAPMQALRALARAERSEEHTSELQSR